MTPLRYTLYGAAQRQTQKPFRRVGWVSIYIEMNGRPYWNPGACLFQIRFLGVFLNTDTGETMSVSFQAFPGTSEKSHFCCVLAGVTRRSVDLIHRLCRETTAANTQT